MEAALEPVRRRMLEVFRRHGTDEVRVLVDFFTHAAPSLVDAVSELRALRESADA